MRPEGIPHFNIITTHFILWTAVFSLIKNRRKMKMEPSYGWIQRFYHQVMVNKTKPKRKPALIQEKVCLSHQPDFKWFTNIHFFVRFLNEFFYTNLLKIIEMVGWWHIRKFTVIKCFWYIQFQFQHIQIMK